MIILGVDGGGTKTHALAVDEHGTIIGSAVAGQSKYHIIGLNPALTVIKEVTQQALNGQCADIAVYCLGDCDAPIDEQRLLPGLRAFDLAQQVVCYNDSFAALRAGSTRSYGVAVICGTGFNACGIGVDGHTASLYSLGALTGDWGGGYSIGEAVFGAVYRGSDGRGKPTMLHDMLLKALGMTDLDTLAAQITDNAISPDQVAVLSPLAFEAAEAGDEVARGIIARQADEIAVSALAMLRRLNLTNLPVDVVVAGGVTKGQGSLLLDETRQRVLVECPQAEVHRLEVPPVIGAVCLAFDALKMTAPHPTQFQNTSQHYKALVNQND